jgi:putative phosphoribosyl transferase
MRTTDTKETSSEKLVHIPVNGTTLEGALAIPENATGLVLFAHGSGSSRFSPRNNFVAAELRRAGLGTLLIDLLTRTEDQDYERRFDIPLLTRRVVAVSQWLANQPATRALALGLFGASTGAAAALQAAAHSNAVQAVVSRGGRPDLAGRLALTEVQCATLLIVGGNDDVVIELHQQAYALLNCPKKLEIVPGATHLFEEPGTLEQVAALAADWFRRHLAKLK